MGGGAFICMSCEAGVDFRALNKKSFKVARHCRSRVSTLQYVEPSGDGGQEGMIPAQRITHGVSHSAVSGCFGLSFLPSQLL